MHYETMLAHARELGTIQATMAHLTQRLDGLEREVGALKTMRSGMPLDTMKLWIGLLIVALASAGKITWSEALPALHKLLGVG